MTYRLIIRPQAELDIQDAFEWYEAQALGLGSEFIRAVDACLSAIERNPLAYQIIKNLGLKPRPSRTALYFLKRQFTIPKNVY